jgi:uncharacterized membrane protein YkoI
MFDTTRKTLVTLAVIAAAGLGGSALATAATSGSSSSSTAATPAAQAPHGGPGAGSHVGANGKAEVPLTGDTAAKVKAAALDKVPGATVERVETDVDHGSPYEAHLTKADGTQLEVLVDADFTVTAVNTMMR